MLAESKSYLLARFHTI